MNDFFESVLPALFVVIVSVVAAFKAKKVKQGQKKASSAGGVNRSIRREDFNLSYKQHGEGHTHDRLDFDCYSGEESAAEHSKRQLDSFLKAGLIDRKEYHELYSRWIG